MPASPDHFKLAQGVNMLLTACENETHIDLIINALKARGGRFFGGLGWVKVPGHTSGILRNGKLTWPWQ